MSASGVNMYCQFGQHTQHLIDYCIENAVEFCNDMFDEDINEPNLSEFRTSVHNQALAFMRMELDPEHGDVMIPPSMTNAIKERINARVKRLFFFEVGQ